MIKSKRAILFAFIVCAAMIFNGVTWHAKSNNSKDSHIEKYKLGFIKLILESKEIGNGKVSFEVLEGTELEDPFKPIPVCVCSCIETLDGNIERCGIDCSKEQVENHVCGEENNTETLR